jgi:trehalose/maltose transport system substrate-binding protein
MRGGSSRSRTRRDPVGALLAVTLAVAATGAGCGAGSDTGAGGARTLNWYVFNEPGGAYDAAAANCNKQAKGRYKINYVKLPTDANQQRELLVRRLAAKDSSVDIAGMDVIWTAEFAQAGWIKPWTGANRAKAIEGRLEGPLKTVEYKGQVWGAPFTTNTQLLWFRKDRVKKPPENLTWDQLIDQASNKGTAIEVQGNQYEGLTVWVNALIAGAGGQIVDQKGDVKVNRTAETAAEIIKKLATSKAAPPGLQTNKEDEARLGFQEGRSDYQVNYTFIYASAAEQKGFQDKIGWTRYPRTVAERPSRPPLGGINLGIGSYSKNPDLAYEAALCLAQPKNQIIAGEKGGLPPTTESLYIDPKVKKAFPFADVLRTSIEEGGPRPVIAAYSDVSLAVQKTYHPEPKIQPSDIVSQLRDRMKKAAEGKIF